jgi:ketosteroid isomerase-like protein
VLTLLGLAFYGLSHPTLAQDPAKQSMRTDVLEALSKFTQAANQADIPALSTMMSAKPGVVYIADGTITRGPDAIGSALNNLVGKQGKYNISLGSLDVANVNGLALATGPYVLKLKGESATASLKGAVTILLEYQGKKKWVITHIHRSTEYAVVEPK